MIAYLAAKLISWRVSPKIAKPLVWVVLIAIAVAAFMFLKSCYDDDVIDEARIEENAKAIEAKAEADVKAAEHRAEDDIRLDSEIREIKETVNEARMEGRDARAAYYECVRLQQAARKAGRPAPAC